MKIVWACAGETELNSEKSSSARSFRIRSTCARNCRSACLRSRCSRRQIARSQRTRALSHGLMSFYSSSERYPASASLIPPADISRNDKLYFHVRFWSGSSLPGASAAAIACLNTLSPSSNLPATRNASD